MLSARDILSDIMKSQEFYDKNIPDKVFLLDKYMPPEQNKATTPKAPLRGRKFKQEPMKSSRRT